MYAFPSKQRYDRYNSTIGVDILQVAVLVALLIKLPDVKAVYLPVRGYELG